MFRGARSWVMMLAMETFVLPIASKIFQLESLSFFTIPFADKWMRQLCLLRNLQKLAVAHCCITASELPLAALRVDSLSRTQDERAGHAISHSSDDMR